MNSVRFIRSRVWADEHGRNHCGVLVIQSDEPLFAAREVAKADARPALCGSQRPRGIVGNISHTGRIALTYISGLQAHLSVGREDHYSAERGESCKKGTFRD